MGSSSSGATTSARAAASRSRKASRASERPADHGDLWGAISEVRVHVAEIKGRVSIILMGVAAIFVAVLGLLLGQVFG